jgi:hypothetical protein
MHQPNSFTYMLIDNADNQLGTGPGLHFPGMSSLLEVMRATASSSF